MLPIRQLDQQLGILAEAARRMSDPRSPLEDRSTLFECRNAQLPRIRGLNEFLVDVFVRTRKKAPAHVIIDLDPTDDACHGHQQLSFWHGDDDQNQYFPMLVLERPEGSSPNCLRPTPLK